MKHNIDTKNELVQHLKKMMDIKVKWVSCVERGDDLSSLKKEGIILEKLN